MSQPHITEQIKALIIDLKEHEGIARKRGETDVERGIMLGRVELEALLIRNGASMPATINA